MLLCRGNLNENDGVIKKIVHLSRSKAQDDIIQRKGKENQVVKIYDQVLESYRIKDVL